MTLRPASWAALKTYGKFSPGRSLWIIEHLFDSVDQVERRRWWWNGRWGRLARRDVIVHEHEGRWFVQARKGGAEGHSNWAEAASEAVAVELALSIRDRPDEWSELPANPR
jgi:hypothetical protein